MGNSMKRGAGIVLNYNVITPYDADVENGATQEEYERLRARSLG